MMRNSFIAWLLLCSICHAQQVRLRVQSDSNGRASVGYGGCVMIGLSQPSSNWVFATAAHNVRNASQVDVMLDNKWKRSKVIAADFKNDIAVVVTLPGQQKLRSYVIGTDAKAGEKVKLRGLYLGKEERDLWGTALSSSLIQTINDSVIVGDSGCPFFRKNSELVGIQSAKIPQTKQAIIVPASQLKALLIQKLGYIPSQPQQKQEQKQECKIIVYSGSKCRYCQKWKRDELPKLKKIKVEIIEDNRQADQQANVTAYPTFIAMKSGKEITRKVGYATAQEVKAMCPLVKREDKNVTCKKCLPPPNAKCQKCKQQFDQLTRQLQSLSKTISSMNSELFTLQNQPTYQQEISELQNQLNQANLRIKALEPLLNRRLVLESETGKVTAQRTYQPHEAIRIRGVYRNHLKEQ